MILTCPACSTRYNVSDASLGDAGRTVRCASCGHSWFQPRQEGASAEAVLKKIAAAVPKPAIPPKAPPPPPVAPHEAARAKAHAKIKARHLAYAASAWGLALILVGGLVAAALANRVEIVKLWPKSASAFAAIGMPANLYGLEIENETVRNGSDANGARLLVAGIIRNITAEEKPIPYLRVTLEDDKGKELASWLVDPGQPTLPPGGKLPFMSEYPTPPGEARQVKIVFADEEPGAEPLAPAAVAPEAPASASEIVVPESPVPPEAPVVTEPVSDEGVVSAAPVAASAPARPAAPKLKPAPARSPPPPKVAANPTPPPAEALPKSFIRTEAPPAPATEPAAAKASE